MKELIEQGANVTGLVRDHVPQSNLYQGEHIKKMNIVRGSLEDLAVIERALGEYEIDTVFHLGRTSDCRRGKPQPDFYL